MVPVAPPALVTCTIKLLELPKLAPGNGMVAPGLMGVACSPLNQIFVCERGSNSATPVKLTVAVAPP